MKKKKNKKEDLFEELDLSDIKENDLDDTASFTDLMSHKEKKAHKKLKKENENIVEDEIEKLEENNEDEDIEFKTDDISSQISENKTIDLSDVVDNKEYDNEDTEYIFENIEEEKEEIVEKENTNIANTIFISMGIIGTLVYYIYSILYTNLQNNKNYLLINGIAIVLLIFNYCLMTISNKKTAKFLTILNYLIIISYITFNILIYLKFI